MLYDFEKNMLKQRKNICGKVILRRGTILDCTVKNPRDSLPHDPLKANKIFRKSVNFTPKKKKKTREKEKKIVNFLWCEV